ncbi:helix-turn-helix domain-containing protein [Flagellimonas sp.]|uniref:helix-turn-helix domain-containing protein n=1 Tax=Flagellimonas sp. TaxID=2058762 RepID=UPI003BB1C1B2
MQLIIPSRIKFIFCSKFVKPSFEHILMMIGKHIRELREDKGMLLRELAAILKIDAAMLSKMERGKRPFREEDLEILSNALNESKEELYTKWLADKALRATNYEHFQSKALELALSICINDKLNYPD